MLLSSSEPFIVYLFAAVNCAYGLASLYLLVAAWRHPRVRLERIARWLASGFIVLWVVGSMDSGMISGLEWGAILVVAVMLIPNYVAVCCALRSHAQPVTPANAE